jgi:hypothetical protein
MAVFPALASAVDLDDPATQWLPRSDGAEWAYTWSDSAYAPVPRTEHYALTQRDDRDFRLTWSDVGVPADQEPIGGWMDFRASDAGLLNLDYQATPAPKRFPLLCPTVVLCGNSISGSLFLTIWGSRSPVIAEPLVRGAVWDSLGGAGNDVIANNRYLGHEIIKVPAFPAPVITAKIRSVITQTGALGDPYGSGVRTVWWVYGVGPVQIRFEHNGGETTTSQLVGTTLVPRPLPSDLDLMPLQTGVVGRFRWRNDRHMKKWSTQRFEIRGVSNHTARFDVRDVSGPIKVRASYVFTSRLGGLMNVSTVYQSVATRSRLPKLGPRDGAEGRRRYVTAFDLMSYGFNPVVPAYATAGQTWEPAVGTRDFEINGVTGTSRVLGTRTVKVPAGRYRAVGVRSTLRQTGHRFGSGSRTSYFAPGVGLVKLTFRHADGSTSTVERTR